MARPSLFTHRKFIKLSRLLGTPYQAAGVLEMIWHHAYQDGDPRLGDVDDIEYMIGWDGPPGRCVDALVEAGFLDVDESGMVTVHDLDDHAPEYVKKRKAREAERKHRPYSDRSVTGQRRTVTRTPAPAPAPAPTPNTQPADAGDEYPNEFEEFWVRYPLKKKKGDALKAWKQTGKKRPPLGALLAKLDALKASGDWTKDGGQFIPYPATWLRADGWEDEVRSPTAKQHVGATPTEHPYHPDDVREYQDHERWDEYLDMCLALPRDRWPAPRFNEWR
jgi:hypothetical protein